MKQSRTELSVAISSFVTPHLVLSALLVLVLPNLLHAQWIAANRKQSQPLKGQGVLYVQDGRMYLWNEEHHFQMSDDNGETWVYAKDTLSGVNAHVSRMTGNGEHLWAGLNFGTGTGVVVHSSDKGLHWDGDTSGAPGHALGWNGMPVVRNLQAFGKWLFVEWDGPNYYDIQELGGPFVRNTYMASNGNQPRSVCATGDTLFVSADTFYYTSDGGKNFTVAKGNNYPGAGLLLRDENRFYLFAIRTWGKPAVLSYSDDHGDNWTDIDISMLTKNRIANGDLYFPIAAFIKRNRMECAFSFANFGKSPNSWSSTDLGQTWAVDTMGLTPAYVPTISCYAYTPDGYLWCSPSYENIYKQKIDGGTTDIKVDAQQNGAPTSDLLISPQPATNTLHCEFRNFIAESIELYSLNGELQMQQSLSTPTSSVNLPLHNISSGSYLIKVNSNNHEFLVRRLSVVH